MEIFIEATSQNSKSQKSVICNSAFFTFVTLNNDRKPVKSIEVKPKTKEEKKLYDGALRRRQLRLILAGKMKPEEANELKSIFN
jgi:acyl-CoA hydrolase